MAEITYCTVNEGVFSPLASRQAEEAETAQAEPNGEECE